MNELDLFAAALAIAGPAERAAYLDRECAADPVLRERLGRLLDAHGRAESPLDPSGSERTLTPGDPSATADYTGAEATGTIIAGKYKLLQQIGEGGMGTVWMADQTEPVKRRVAVKLIRVDRGNSATILARFEAERQAIALMDHPHIAKLLDAGTTGEPGGASTGSPFFVMELVKGIPLTEYCDRHKLSVPQRLGLFQQICSAVQHAHQKGIIHRDIKPSNILVENHDGKPVPKVIDFGLAKATNGMQLTENTLFTGFGTVMGTPLYMAPEQATFNAVDVDTRADIYALGVILYELLTGTTPLTRDTIKKAALDDMLKLIREQEAPTPSSRLSSAENKPSVAANRQLEPAKLGRYVKGELDWIVLKALSKERDRRYETANGFAADIGRFLNHEPVTAGPVSARYRIRKFVRRNRGQVIAAGLVLSALVLGVVGTTLGLLEARRQTGIAQGEVEEKEKARVAEAEQRAAANAEKRKAQDSEEKAMDTFRESTNDGIEQLIGTKRELGPMEKDYVTRTLERWKAFAARSGDDERSSAIRGEAHSRIGSLWYQLGRSDEAKKELQTAREIYVRLVDAYPATLIYQVQLASVLHDLAISIGNEGNLESEFALLDVSGRLAQKLVEDNPNLPVLRIQLASNHNSLGTRYSRSKRYPEARREHELARDLLLKLVAAEPAAPRYRSHLASTRDSLATVLGLLKEHDLAGREFAAAIALQDELVKALPYVPEFTFELAQTENNFGAWESNRGRLEEGRHHIEAALGLLKQLCDFFPAVVYYKVTFVLSCGNLGAAIRDTGKPEEALSWHDIAIRTISKVYEKDRNEPDARDLLGRSYGGRAITLRLLGKFAESANDWDKSIEFGTEIDRPERRAARANMLVKAGRIKEAVAEVADLMKSSKWSADQRYNFACVYALASGSVVLEKQQYADRAMVLLGQCKDSQFMNARHVTQDTDLDPLRDRDDFKKLIAELDAKR